MEAVVGEIGADKVGIRVSHFASFSTIDVGSEGVELYRYLTDELDELGLMYLHVMHTGREDVLVDIRDRWENSLLVNRYGRPREDIAVDIDAGLADVAPVATWALANPDFVERIKADAPLNEADPGTFFGGGAKGYVDYPTMKR